MNFFEHQANARRQTGRLLVYFLAAVLLTALAVNIGFYGLGLFMRGFNHGSWLWHDWSAQAYTGTLLIIMGGSLIEYLHLRDGGRALAEMMGARCIDFSTTAADERQFINVVAEMSIASGVPAPALYVMDGESGINAFVAGLDINQSVMVVTRGALDAFDRDELQAVVGHEFSHILNGDMRLNVRLLALLAGILAIGQIGGFLVRVSFSPDRSSRSERKNAVPYLIAVGMLLWLVGALGLFFGRLIKAAISRQREFLADASSVQFTRNPDALAGALLKIKNAATHSWLINIRAESMSHMCFGETLHFSALFATHPSLEERVRVLGRQYLIRDRIQQRALQQQGETAGQVAQANGVATPESAPVPDLPPIPYFAAAPSMTTVTMTPFAVPAAALVARMGTVNPQELASAQALHRRLPAGVHSALQTSAGAQALLYALVARQSVAPVAVMQAFLQEKEAGLVSQINALCRVLEGLDLSFALPLTELALPRLQLLGAQEQREFLLHLQALAQLDRHLSTFEFALLMLLRKQLQLRVRAHPVKLAQALPALAVIVTTLLRTDGMDGERLQITYRRLMRTVTTAPPDMPAAEFTRLSQFALGLQRLSGLSPQDKKQVLELAATTVLADAEVRLEEYELLRVVAALLDCPMPMLEV
ncbi:MAG: M48 family metallopeptidase [bacterium]|nr:M48 family metallopeptidase [bacterium]